MFKFRSTPSVRQQQLSINSFISLAVIVVIVGLIIQRFHTFADAFSLLEYTTFGIMPNIRLVDRTRHRITFFSAKSSNNVKGLTEILNGEFSEVLEKVDVIRTKKPNEENNERKPSTEGLSKSHQNMAASTAHRQRCVTGNFPLYIKVVENPTRKWLFSAKSSRSIGTSQLLVNGTMIDRSLASYDRYKWIDGEERVRLNEEYALVSLELLGEINVKNPAYVNILPKTAAEFLAKKELNHGGWENRWKTWNCNFIGSEGSDTVLSQFSDQDDRVPDELEKERMWITGFSLSKKSGQLDYVDVQSGYMANVMPQSTSRLRWPNEVNSVPVQRYKCPPKFRNCEKPFVEVEGEKFEDSILVSDGFLVPGRSGGLHVILNPGNEKLERSVCLTSLDDNQAVDERGWFYHRAVWIDLTKDGRMSILTARARNLTFLNSMNDNSAFQNQDGAQLIWLEYPQPHAYDKSTGTPLNIDGTVFNPFGYQHIPWKVRVLDDGPDVMFSVADLDTTDDTIEVIASQFFNKKISLHSIKRGIEPRVVFSRKIDDLCGSPFSSIFANLDGKVESSTTQRVVDSGSTVPTLKLGDAFSHLLVTSHECSFAEDDLEDGSTSSITSNQAINGGSLFSYRIPKGTNAWQTEPWIRSVIATGFHVRGQIGNMMNPGAPGFCYTFYLTKDQTSSRPLIAIAGDCAESAYILRPIDSEKGHDPSASYTLMCQIDCGATIGSIGIGYEDFCFVSQQKGFAKIYVPCYENDKVLVFAMGNGEDS